jgi:hypothetical protein
LGSIEGRFQGEPEHYGCASAKDKEEGRKGCLIGSGEEILSIPQPTQSSAARKSREGPVISPTDMCESVDQPATAW